MRKPLPVMVNAGVEALLSKTILCRSRFAISLVEVSDPVPPALTKPLPKNRSRVVPPGAPLSQLLASLHDVLVVPFHPVPAGCASAADASDAAASAAAMLIARLNWVCRRCNGAASRA